MPDPDDKFGAGHAFVKKFEKTTVLDKNNQPTDSTNQNLTIPEIATNATTAVNEDDVFSWGASTLGTVSSSTTSRPYFGDRTLPPELANPEAHPSPFGETVKKGFFAFLGVRKEFTEHTCKLFLHARNWK